MLTWIFKYKINTKSDLITSSPGYISFLSCLLCHVVFEHVTAIPPAHLRVLNLVCLRIWVFCRPCDISVTRAWLVKPRQDAAILMSYPLGAGEHDGGSPGPRTLRPSGWVWGQLVLGQLSLGLELHAAVAALVAVPGQDAHAAVHYVHLLRGERFKNLILFNMLSWLFWLPCLFERFPVNYFPGLVDTFTAWKLSL